MNDFDQSERIDALSAELAAAKSRIGVLEQERGAEGTNWFPESFVSQLQAQLAAVILDRDALSYELDSFKSENESFRAECVPLRNTVAELQDELAAVTQQKEAALEAKTRLRELHMSIIGGVREEKDSWRRVAEGLEGERARLQAHNKAMRAALTMIRDHAYPENMQRSFAHAALTEEEKP